MGVWGCRVWGCGVWGFRVEGGVYRLRAAEFWLLVWFGASGVLLGLHVGLSETNSDVSGCFPAWGGIQGLGLPAPGLGRRFWSFTVQAS